MRAAAVALAILTLLAAGFAVAGWLVTSRQRQRTAEAAVTLDRTEAVTWRGRVSHEGWNITFHFQANGKVYSALAYHKTWVATDLPGAKVCYRPSAPEDCELVKANFRCGDSDLLAD